MNDKDRKDGRKGRLNRLTALLLGLSLFGCGDGPTEPQVATVQIAGSAEPLVLGQSRQFTATPRDGMSTAVQGQTVIWASSNPQVASVNAAGLVSSVAVGSVQITASVGSVVGSMSLQVVLPPVATISISPPALQLTPDESATLQVTLRDSQGNVLHDRAVTWAVSNTAIATVNASGTVEAVAPGSATITASSEGIQGSATVTVTSGFAPTIAGLAPSPMREGEEVVLTGTGFSPSSQSNVVRIGGVDAQVLESGADFLRVLVPSGQCAPEGLQEVTITVGGETSAATSHPFLPESVLLMEVGEFQRIAFPENLCFRLEATTANEEYLVGVQSTTPTALSVTPARLTSQVGVEVRAASTLDAPGHAASPPGGRRYSDVIQPSAGHAHPLLPQTGEMERWDRHLEAKAHLRFLEERTPGSLVSGSTAPAAAALAEASTPARVPGTVQPGDTVQIRFPDISSSNFCQTFIAVSAVVRKVGTASIWLEDIENPVGGFAASDYDALSAQFDEIILPEIASYFGAPADFDSNGRVVIMISRQVNRISNALGFVVSTDFSPGCPSSNSGEFYYARASDPDGGTVRLDGTNAPPYSIERALADAPILLAHEVTHIIQFGRRIMAGSPFATVWEMEGQATFAEEIAGFRVLGRSPGQNYGFDVAWNVPPTGAVNWHRPAFTDLALYYGFQSATVQSPDAPHACGWFARTANGPCATNRLVYGVSWAFLRWLSDHYGPRFAGGERELHRRLVDSNQTGFATFETVIGETMPSMLAPWAASLYTDERVAPLDPRLVWPSWNLRSIEAGLAETARLRPKLEGFNAYTRSFSVAAGSSAYVLMSGGDRSPTGVRARSGDGEMLASHMQLWIVRIR